MEGINKSIYLHGEFGVDITSDMVIPQIDAAISEGVKVLTFDISSIGGSVKTGREIMGAIERAKLAGIQIATQCLSFAYSMGANVFLMGTKGMRKMSEHAELMIHPVMGVAEGNAKDMMQVVTSLQEMSNNLLEYATKGNEANAEAIKASFENEEMIGAAKAIALGLADGYVEKLKAVAYYSKQIDMKKENIEEAKGLVKQLQDALAKIGINFSKTKNTSTVAGETTFYYNGNLEVGTAVFSDEAMTIATTDGVYGDYTVSDGKVSAIAAEPTDEAKQLAEAQAKVTELQAALDAKNAEVNSLNEKFEQAETKNKTEIEAINANMKKLETVILGEEGRHREEETVKLDAKASVKQRVLQSLNYTK